MGKSRAKVMEAYFSESVNGILLTTSLHERCSVAESMKALSGVVIFAASLTSVHAHDRQPHSR